MIKISIQIAVFGFFTTAALASDQASAPCEGSKSICAPNRPSFDHMREFERLHTKTIADFTTSTMSPTDSDIDSYARQIIDGDKVTIYFRPESENVVEAKKTLWALDDNARKKMELAKSYRAQAESALEENKVETNQSRKAMKWGPVPATSSQELHKMYLKLAEDAELEAKLATAEAQKIKASLVGTPVELTENTRAAMEKVISEQKEKGMRVVSIKRLPVEQVRQLSSLRRSMKLGIKGMRGGIVGVVIMGAAQGAQALSDEAAEKIEQSDAYVPAYKPHPQGSVR